MSVCMFVRGSGVPAPGVGPQGLVCPVLLAGQMPAAGQTASEPKASCRAGCSLCVSARAHMCVLS